LLIFGLGIGFFALGLILPGFISNKTIENAAAIQTMGFVLGDNKI
jgi:hypothetical protein